MLRLGLKAPGSSTPRSRRDSRHFSVQPPETLDEAAARQIAMKQGVGVVLSGAIDRIGDGYGSVKPPSR